tara:strand:+ start:120 stop:410 length:291 start_codon:yes stop_codon:yes gene_type:complete
VLPCIDCIEPSLERVDHSIGLELTRKEFRYKGVRMSITRLPGKSKELERLKSKKALEEYLKNGGKITEIPEGETTDAATMKYKYRNARKKKVVPEE